MRAEDAAELERIHAFDIGVPVLEREARRISMLFVICAFSLVLLLAWVLLSVLVVDSAPVIVAMVGVSFLSGMMAAWALGIYVVATAHRWLWLILMVVPFTTLPAGLVYAWRRRMEIEREILENRT